VNPAGGNHERRIECAMRRSFFVGGLRPASTWGSCRQRGWQRQGGGGLINKGSVCGF